MNNPFTAQENIFFADLHIHSKYSRATSKRMNPLELDRVARQKGIKVLATGDFTHPAYLDELEEQLEPAEPGLYVPKERPDGTRFMLTAEIANIFTQGGKGRRIHTVVCAPEFEVAREIQKALAGMGNIESDGRPIFGFPVKELVRLVMDISPRCFVIPAHIWTPWFSLFGAKSGFDSVEECFEEQSEHIYALETGLSSDPQMNWRLSALDRFVLVSNSDAHSPAKVGRECNLFSCQLSYDAMIEAMKEPAKGFAGTVEFFPEEGKYHYDGHRACGVCLPPAETRRLNGICPVCGGRLTIGVLHRVEDLADREEGFVPPSALPNVHLVTLLESIMEALGSKSAGKKVMQTYDAMIEMGGNEMEILLWKDLDDLAQVASDEILLCLERMRAGKISIRPGHDGLYGEIHLLGGDRTGLDKSPKRGGGATQLNLF